jgi:hypothetical protein
VELWLLKIFKKNLILPILVFNFTFWLERERERERELANKMAGAMLWGK